MTFKDNVACDARRVLFNVVQNVFGADLSVWEVAWASSCSSSACALPPLDVLPCLLLSKHKICTTMTLTSV